MCVCLAFSLFFACVYKCTHVCACMCVEQKVPGLLCAVPAGRGCQNGPISCVSSKIGPNTAETHDTLRLFTALTQCVSGALPSVRNLSVLRRICSETAGKMHSLAKNAPCEGSRKTESKWQVKTVLPPFVWCLEENEVLCMPVGLPLTSPPLPPPYVNVLWTVWLSRPASVIASTSCSLDCCPHCVHDNHNIVPNPADVLQGPAQGNVPLEQSHNDRAGKKDSSSLWFWKTSDPAEHSAVPSVQMYLLLNRGRFGFSSSSIPLCASTWKPAFKIRATVGAVSYFTGTDPGQQRCPHVFFIFFHLLTPPENFELTNGLHHPPPRSGATSQIFVIRTSRLLVTV